MLLEDFAVDLSRVLFVGTANDEAAINLVMCDRLHIIRLDGYDEHEKLQITKRSKSAFGADNVYIGDDVIAAVKVVSRARGLQHTTTTDEELVESITDEVLGSDAEHSSAKEKPQGRAGTGATVAAEPC